MAKPIRKTPSLKGKSANNFVEEMIKVEKRRINKTEKKLLKLLL